MTLGLLRAVRRTLANHNTYSDVLEGAYDATIAEIRKRRKESPWKGPFKVGHIDVLDSHLFKAARDVSFEQNQSKNIAAALNAYYGYTADGKDILEGL